MTELKPPQEQEPSSNIAGYQSENPSGSNELRDEETFRRAMGIWLHVSDNDPSFIVDEDWICGITGHPPEEIARIRGEIREDVKLLGGWAAYFANNNASSSNADIEQSHL